MMNWSSQMEVHYSNNGGMPYNSIGSFVDFFGGVAYDHVNFIFADAPYAQESMYPSISSNPYKYGFSGHGNFSYYDYSHPYVENNPSTEIVDEYTRPPLGNDAMLNDDQFAAGDLQRQGNSSSTSHASPVECPRHQQNNREEVVWQDNIDPDHMTYEELLELGEAVGTQSRGLPDDLISLLPVTKYKRSIFSRKRSRERCVICQMEYKRGEKRMTLPCKHIYHAGCCRRWLGINKACPICYTEVVINASKH